MLQINNLTLTHIRDLRTMIKDFSLTLNPGDKAAVIGEEGNGKSTLLKLIYDESMVSSYTQHTGSIIKNGAKIGYLAQELTPAERKQSIYDFCGEKPAFFDATPKELALLSRQLGLTKEFFYSDRTVDSLSGGEKVKLQLALILMERPDVLLLDEPSNDIDIETLHWLETFIKEAHVPVLFISHDEVLLENTANMVVHLELLHRKTVPRSTVIKMPYAEYVGTRLCSLEKQGQLARKERSEYQKQQERFRQIEQKVEHRQNTISRQDAHGGRLLKKKMHAVKSLERRFEKEHQNMTELPVTEDAILIRFDENLKIPNGKRVLDFTLDELTVENRVLSKNIKLQITGPQKICIIGKNGVGKSTLLKKQAAQLCERTDINAYYMPQNYEELLDFRKTPVEFLCPTGDRSEQVTVRKTLAGMKYTAEEMNHKIADLSGGQKAKLFFLKMVRSGCNVLILDEPTRNFSPLSGPVIRQLLRDFGGAILSVSHDRKYIREVCGRVYELTGEGLSETENV